jgi:protein TonB
MMAAIEGRNRDRLKSAAAVALFHGLLAWALIVGLGVGPIRSVADPLKMFDISDEPPPPPAAEPPPPSGPMTPREQTPDPEGAAAPPNLRDTPTPVAAPPTPLDVPTPLPAAPVPGQGSAAAAGAAEIRGPGTGAGGLGTGTGSGLSGSGTGGGGGGGLGRAVEARWLRGRIRESDYPRGAIEAGASGTVGLRFVVAPDGRVNDCRVTRSSGRSDLDTITCRLIMQRFRYRPARDSSGRPVAEVVTGQHAWIYDEREPVEDYDEE